MLSLRPYKSIDADIIASWIKDETSLYKWSSDRFGKFPLTGDDINSKYVDNNGDCVEPDNFYSLTAYDETGIVGNLILRYTDESKKIIRFGFIIVDDTKRGKGYGKQMLLLAEKFAFELLNATECTLGVFDNNMPAYNCYKAAGFKETGEIIPVRFAGVSEEWKVIELKLTREDYFK